MTKSKNLNFGLSSSNSEGFTSQILGFFSKAIAEGAIAEKKSTRDASKVPEGEGEKPEVQVKKTAVVCANGVGDGLIYMTLSHNLHRSGYDVTTFSTPLCQLREWFPEQDIKPFPQNFDTFENFDQIIAADHSMVPETTDFGGKLTILRENRFDPKKTLVSNLAHLCQTRYNLPHYDPKNGISIPKELAHRHYPKRVIIHPTTLETKREWPADKFLRLAHKLQARGWEPVFAVSPRERAEWEEKAHPFECPIFPSLSDLAAYLYESGAMIGNNSGTGHLASNLGIPTLSLFAKKSYSRLWRPGFGPGKVVTPPQFLIGGGLKLRHWKRFLTISRVLRHFEKLEKSSITE